MQKGASPLNKENQSFFRVLDLISDVLLILASMLLSYALRFRVLQGEENVPLAYYLRCALGISFLFLFLFAVTGLYEHRRSALILQLIQKIILISLSCTGVMAIAFFTSRAIDVSRLLLFLFFLLSSCLLSIKRILVFRIRRSSYVRGLHVHQVLLVGSGRTAKEYIRNLEEMPWLGYRVMGSFGKKPVSDDVPYFGQISSLEEALRETAAEELVAALDPEEFPEMDELIRQTEKNGLKFSLIPYFAPYMLSRPYIDQVGDLPLINIRRIPLDNVFNAILKRCMDVAGTLLLIVLTSPVMLFAAVGTLLTLGRPVIFRQVRVGYQRKDFTMLKFRSMRPPSLGDSSGWSCFEGSRLTRFGAFLRKTSIDELPQLFNVLRGEMSLVGPRPELPQYVDMFRESVPLYMLKHQVRPGITGLAQVNGYRGDTSIEARIRLDLRYIETWSILLDVRILFSTLFHFMNTGGNVNHEENKPKPR